MDPRTIWQDKAEAHYFSERLDDYLITACPGSGKTKCALRIAKRLMDQREVANIIVVAPTSQVRRQWAEAATEFGLDLTEQYDSVPSECHGVVITYQRMSKAPLVYQILSSRRDTLLIIDEVHHCSESDHAEWGRALREVGEVARFRLLLSGTPFRSDGRPIPFVTYDSDGQAQPSHGITYGEAVGGGIVRPIRFEVIDGVGHWEAYGGVHSENAGSVSARDRGPTLRSLYLPDGKWIQGVFRSAIEELGRLREDKPNAAGLILANDKALARQYAAVLSQMTGADVPVVTADSDDAQGIVSRFRDGAGRWIVAVKMISEGVDIPRLGVCVYASTVVTDMWFRQVVGRITRKDGADDYLQATMFIPAISELQEFAERVEDEALAALEENDLAAGPTSDDMRQIPIELSVALPPGEAQRIGVIDRDRNFTEQQIAEAASWQKRLGGELANVHPATIAGLLMATGRMNPAQVVVEVPPDPPQMSGDQKRKAKRRLINQLVAQRHRQIGTEHSHIHSELNRICREKSVKDASANSLQKRIDILRGWIADAA